MSDRHYPYKTLVGTMELDFGEVRFDDRAASPDPRDREKKQIHLQDQDNSSWSTVSLPFELKGPSANELAEISGGMDAKVVAVIRCTRTRERRGILLKKLIQDVPIWSGTAQLDRADYRGEATVEALLSGTVEGSPSRFLGSSTTWTLHFDEPAVSRKTGSIDIKWKDFGAEDAPLFLREYATEPFYADLSAGRPTLYLNKAKEFKGLPILLGDRRRRGRDEALHNSQRLGVARSVWMALLNASVAGIQEGDEGEEPEWPTESWQKQVLRILLPNIYRGCSESEALNAACDAWKNPLGARLLESRGQVEIERRIRGAKILRRTLDRLDDRTIDQEID